MSVELWTGKYRPKSLDEYVWKDAAQRAKASDWLAAGALPHLLFSGTQGTGKTSIALLLIDLLGIPSGDILFKNASKERKIDDLQDAIVGFASTWALNDTGFKYVVLDEADSLSPLAQKFLRGEMEKFENSCRFILTANYPQKIIPALHSRLQEMKFSALDIEAFMGRLMEILLIEGVEFDPAQVIEYTKATYPDLRKAIGLIQQHTRGKVLATFVSGEQVGGKDYLLEMVSLFKRGEYNAARKIVVESAQVEEYVDIYRYFYQNLDLWGSTEEKQNAALLAIRRGLVHHAVVADPEINLAACMVELLDISRS